MTSFAQLSDATPAPEPEGLTPQGADALDEVVASPRGRSRARNTRSAASPRLRSRLLALQRATDRELRRRGVVALPGTQSRLSPARVRELLDGVARQPAAQTRAVRNALSGLTETQQLRAVRDAIGGLSRLPRPSIPTRVPSRETLQQEVPMQLMGAIGQLALTLRDLTGRDVIDLESLNEVLSFAYRAADVRRQHNELDYKLDVFGFDPVWTEAILPLVRLIYRKYWRVEAFGVDNVPRRGSALLVSNHAGVLPFDGAMIKTALFEHGIDRHARALIADWFFTLPLLSWFLRRSGQTLGNPNDTHRLLSDGELVLVFPEGVKGTGKLWSERYRLRRFGRGGFVESAIRAGAPIIPISVVGSEELYPMLADVRPLAQLTGFPYFPLTPTWPWLGPLGLVPLPSKWRIQFHPAVRTDELPRSAADDPSIVMDYADRVRDTIQEGLVANLMQRRSVFRG